MLNMRIMCVNPIEIDTTEYEKLIGKKSRIGSLIGRFDNNVFDIEWLRIFNELHTDYSSFCSVYERDEPRKSAELLKADLQEERFFVNGLWDISEYIDLEKTTYDLVLDQSLFTFALVIELHFSLPKNLLPKILSTQTNDISQDFYNTLRNLLVKEQNDTVISAWGSAVRKEVCDRIQAISFPRAKDTSKPIASLRNNSGNITLFVEESPKNQAIKDLFLNCNEIAERVRGNDSTIIDDDDVHYAFFSRFHTIITEDISRYYRFAPIQCHIQLTWYFVGYFSRVLDRLNKEVIASGTKSTLNSKRNVIDEYINKIVLLSMKNENFKLIIESDNKNVYQKIENKWNLESSLDQAKAYVNFFKDYLERAHARRVAQSNRSQNRILFTISCIQILGLISIWADYLGLKKLADFVDRTGMYRESSVETILHVNTWLPLALVSVLILLVLTIIIFNRE
jgi:hypothetical protein